MPNFCRFSESLGAKPSNPRPSVPNPPRTMDFNGCVNKAMVTIAAKTDVWRPKCTYIKQERWYPAALSSEMTTDKYISLCFGDLRLKRSKTSNLLGSPD
jgi:hypothetical protein